MESKVRHLVHKSPSLVRMLSQFNPLLQKPFL